MSSKLFSVETSKRKISDEDSTAATEGDTEVDEEKASSVIDGEDIQSLAVDPEDLERIEVRSIFHN